MLQYLPDDRGILNAGDDVHGRTNAVGAWMRRNGHLGRSTADSAGCHVNVEHPLEPLCPGHRHMTLRGCLLIRICCNFPGTPAPPGWGVGCELVFKLLPGADTNHGSVFPNDNLPGE